jgi:hypothetical protein
MGFNKRYLSEGGIRSYAKSNRDSFNWFERYMVGADAYIIESEPEDFASKFYDEFRQSNQEKRKELFNKLINEEI